MRRRDVDLSRFAWEASRPGARGKGALEVLQDLLLERYGAQLKSAQRYAKLQKAPYAILFVPQLTRWTPIQSTFGRLPSLRRGDQVTVIEGSGRHSGRRATVDRVQPGMPTIVELIDWDTGEEIRVAASRLREGWGKPSLRFKRPMQHQFAPFKVVPSGRARNTPKDVSRHTYRTSIVIWDTESGFNVHPHSLRP